MCMYQWLSLFFRQALVIGGWNGIDKLYRINRGLKYGDGVCVCVCVYVCVYVCICRIHTVADCRNDCPGKGVTLLTVYWKTQWVLRVLYHHVWHSEISCYTHRRNLLCVDLRTNRDFFLQYSINGLVFVTVMECVYCTVDLVIQANLIKARVMAQADSRRPLTM